MGRPRSNKLQNKGKGTPFGKQSKVEQSFRKRDRRPPSDDTRRAPRSEGADFKPRSSGYRSDEGGRKRHAPDSKGPYKKREGGYGSTTGKPDYRESKPKSFGPRGDSDNRERPFKKPAAGRPFPSRADGPPRFSKSGDFKRTDKPFRKPGEGKPFTPREEGPPRYSRSGPPRSEDGDRPEKSFDKRDDKRVGGFTKRPYTKRDESDQGQKPEKRSFVQARVIRSGDFTKPIRSKGPGRSRSEAPPEKQKIDDGLTRLNKYIANSGVGSRRQADELIKMGLIKVNGVTITELGTKVKQGDEVRYEDRVLRAENLVYLLLNKPKGFITTTDDPQERNTVMGLVAGACKERIYPVGRLDRNTTGLLLLTNDGDLADKLTHPSYKAKKVYKVELDRPLTKNDLQKIMDGVQLEEGRAMVDDIAIISDDNKTVGLEIHIGWNRVVRRIFESLGYEVGKLDRSVFAGLDKKDLSRGQWRFLKPEEIVRLKHFK